MNGNSRFELGASIRSFYKTEIYENNTVIYEDEKVLCVIPEKSLVEGHLEIYSKSEEKYIDNLSIEDSSHLFFTASLATTLVFEGLQLGQQGGTNIIVKSGDSDDNPGGKLCVHVLPRKQDDSFKSLAWEPKQPSYNLDDIQKKIKDKSWGIKYAEKSEESAPIQEKVIVDKIKEDETKEESESENNLGKKEYSNHEEEISEAIKKLQ